MLAEILTSETSKALDKAFGNYRLHGFSEVELPAAITWWPQTLGWKILAILIIFWLLRLIYRQIQRWRQNRYRRVALKKLDSLVSSGESWQTIVQSLPPSLKATTLHVFPRREVAHLSGARWLEFLDKQCANSIFLGQAGERLLMVSYQPQRLWQINEGQAQELIDLVRFWIAEHRNPYQSRINRRSKSHHSMHHRQLESSTAKGGKDDV